MWLRVLLGCDLESAKVPDPAQVSDAALVPDPAYVSDVGVDPSTSFDEESNTYDTIAH